VDLVNLTPVPASLSVSPLDGKPFRAGVITAKATFLITSSGAELDAQHPLPLLRADRATELGVLPSDDLIRRDPAFEVIVLGAAHAPSGQAVEAMTVALAVGDRRREIAVHGDRVWEVSGEARRISRPEPFTRIPLTWDRAFGGTAEVLVDEESPIDIADPRNPLGRGFDPGPPAHELCRAWKAPAGFPVYDEVRRLPNLEDPTMPIRTWEDTPVPISWATMDPGSPLHRRDDVTKDEAASMPLSSLLAAQTLLFRAHPDWILDRPRAGALVRIDGMTADGVSLAFELPGLRVFADYVTGRYRGTRELFPQMLVLLPEERRFYLVYRHAFTVQPSPGAEQGMRLRVQERGTPSEA
jgi:hypothetical protein